MQYRHTSPRGVILLLFFLKSVAVHVLSISVPGRPNLSCNGLCPPAFCRPFALPLILLLLVIYSSQRNSPELKIKSTNSLGILRFHFLSISSSLYESSWQNGRSTPFPQSRYFRHFRHSRQHIRGRLVLCFLWHRQS